MAHDIKAISILRDPDAGGVIASTFCGRGIPTPALRDRLFGGQLVDNLEPFALEQTTTAWRRTFLVLAGVRVCAERRLRRLDFCRPEPFWPKQLAVHSSGILPTDPRDKRTLGFIFGREYEMFIAALFQHVAGEV